MIDRLAAQVRIFSDIKYFLNKIKQKKNIIMKIN